MSFVSTTAFCVLGLTAAMAAHAGPDALEKAQLTFQRNCASCHSLEPGRNLVGPSLYGVYGRKAGALDDYAYSASLRQLDTVWSDSSLDAFLADSQKIAPGAKMYVRLADPKVRSALVSLLKATPGSAP